VPIPNKSSNFAIILGLVAAFALITQTATHVSATHPTQANQGQTANERIPNQYIVVLKEGNRVAPQNIADEARERGAEAIHVYEHAIKGFTIRGPDSAVQHFRNDPRVDYVEQDQSVKNFARDNLVQTFAQILPTGIDRVDAELSSIAAGDGNVAVAVDIAIIDTGIDLKHPDLNVFMQKTFVKGTRSADDDNGHGTHVAGTAAAKDNNDGVAGVAPGAKLWAVKVLNRSGSGYMSDVIAGVDYVTQKADMIEVANMSLGCECTSSALNTAIHNSVAAGVTYVVAAGNSAKDASTFSPANHPDVITVSAIADSDGKCGGLGQATTYGNDDSFAAFSNFGSTIEIAAPGVNIKSTYKDDSYASMSGTSMASPHVAGAAGLYKSVNPDASPADVRNALLSQGIHSGTDCDGNGHGYFTGDPDQIPEPLLYVRTL